MMNPGVESLENRKLMATAALIGEAGVQYIGMTAGVVAAANPATTGIAFADHFKTGKADRDTAINLKVNLDGGTGVKATSFNRLQFALFKSGSNTPILTSKVQTSGGGDTITIKPSGLLEANTAYRIEFNRSAVVGKITNIDGEAFAAATYTFSTGTFYNTGDPNIKFSNQVQVTKSANGSFSAVTIGPDNRLYAATLEGYIYRYNIAADGSLSGETAFDIVRRENGGARFITGITFDPRSTDPTKPVLWVSHGQAKFGDSKANFASNYTGKISRLLNNLSDYQDVIVNIPRSVKDHLNNQISFDPAQRNLYFLIPSHSAMGRADAVWGGRAEELATAAMFRLQLQTRGDKAGIEDWLAKNGPINLDPNARRPYNFYKGSNPLRFYATGVRNAYDMLWHSNGRLYVPANSSAAGGNTPEDPTQAGTQQRDNVQQTIDDYLFDVREGGYYGHPNPMRGEYVLNGGNPTSANTDVAQIGPYPVGTLPGANYRGFAFNFGQQESPNGVIEYKSNAFGGRLKGQLIVARYSSGDDLVFLKPNADGTFNQNTAQTAGTQGLTGLTDVLDLVEDTRNGNLYTVALEDMVEGTIGTGQGMIRLHKPISTTSGIATPSTTRLKLRAAPGGASMGGITLTNTSSSGSLTVDVSEIRLTGARADRRSFSVTNLPTSDLVLSPGQSFTFQVRFVSGDTTETVRAANLAIATNDPRGQYIATVQLRGTTVPGILPASMPMARSGGVRSGPTSDGRAIASLFGTAAIGGDDSDLLVW